MFRLLTPAAVLTLMTASMNAQAQPGPFRVFPGSGFPGQVYKSFRPSEQHVDHYHVQFRQLNWQTQVFQNHREAREFENFKRSQGFEVRCELHGDHIDVEFRRPNWTTYRTVNRDSYAHQLEHWLESQGYDARVVHH